ncbi:hypothetical protein CKK33_07825 [Mucilaginibacter sp. MD40]|uniref:hypothetical protein n=1 Tax=Mucilaginibacter sp. MD40 TaxID=2029590 RepID=UPI000BAC603E|nr:hypothetical protein [Mucilaginibacter sp. MD40]PAW93401.1 hypothetical protein CKK33_07825 [Mucilaginibacter sp. MD40]
MVKFVSYPPPRYSEGNPFMELYYNELKSHGWELAEFNFTIPNLIKHAGNVQVCYFHWPQTVWRKGNLPLSFIKCLYFRFNCLVAKALGYRLIWSAHNALPHEYHSLRLEKWMRRFLIKKFDLIVGHAENAYNDLKTVVGFDFKKKYVLVEHGTYGDWYKAAGLITRETLGIPADKKVVLLKCSGKDYQGTQDAVNYLLNNEIPAHLHFLLIGNLANEDKQALLKKERVSVIDRKVSEAELADIFVLADIVWMPYRRITTSGFYQMAIGFEKPVLATDIEFFRLHSEPGMIYLYNHTNMHKTISNLLINYKGHNFAGLKQRFNWHNNVTALLNAYGKK